jgi:hypothetical protein
MMCIVKHRDNLLFFTPYLFDIGVELRAVNYFSATLIFGFDIDTSGTFGENL